MPQIKQQTLAIYFSYYATCYNKKSFIVLVPALVVIRQNVFLLRKDRCTLPPESYRQNPTAESSPSSSS